jgi:hypothetical protein
VASLIPSPVLNGEFRSWCRLRAVAAQHDVTRQVPEHRGVVEPDDVPGESPKLIETTMGIGNHDGHSSGAKRRQLESRFATIARERVESSS